VINHSYIGSCRHQTFFSRYYTPRLHSLGEIAFLLENLDIFRALIEVRADRVPMFRDILNVFNGDSVHPIVKDKTVKFFKDVDQFFESNAFVLEVSSLSYLERGQSVASEWYNSTYRVFNEDYLSRKTMGHEDVRSSLQYIYSILRYLSKRNCYLYLIPNVDLPLSSENEDRIEKRLMISKVLEDAVRDLSSSHIKVIPIWDHLRGSTDTTLSTVMKGRSHFSEQGFTIIRKYLEDYFQAEDCQNDYPL